MAALERVDVPGSRRSFAVDTAEVQRARSFVTAFLVDRGMDELVADAELAVSELFGNAVVHSRGATEVDVVISPSTEDVRFEVRDDGEPPTRDLAAGDPSPADPSGRGLMVVGLVASRWGVETADSGTSVWFELDR